MIRISGSYYFNHIFIFLIFFLNVGHLLLKKKGIINKILIKE